ncbi:MAG: ABC transporter ATP-binding protein [Chloroflexia bacterium]|nr:ABC transporter ATP-binding protein [Chloroflexia bacterium]
MLTKSWIRLCGVTRQFSQGLTLCWALRGIDLNVPQGAFLAIVGPSGSGKTTLLNLLAGIDRPSAGQVWVGDWRLDRLDEESLARWRGRYVGIVFQFFQLFPTLTALENVRLPLELQAVLPARERRRRALDALEQVGLAGRAQHLPAQLSGGEQQRVALARALIHDPLLVVADEPTGNLDSESGRHVVALLRQVHRQGKTVLMVTHDRQLAQEASLRLHLRDGRIVSREEDGDAYR